MDPFLPGEVPVMVLRYLAANKCEAAALALIEEMPLLKAHVPPKPAKVSNSDYLKYLARSSVNTGLKDVLSDYGNSKILAEEILEGDGSSSPKFPSSDTLLNKMKTIQDLCKTKPPTSSVNSSPIATTSSSNSNIDSLAVKVDGCVNTDEFYQCPQCLLNQNKPKTESGCQTEEVTGLQDEIPGIFCRTLLQDDDVPQKLAKTINEYFQDPQAERNELVEKASSKAQTEIDKYFIEFLQDIRADSNGAEIGGGVLDLGNGPSASSVYAEVDSNLSAMFGDAAMLMGGETSDFKSQTNKAQEQQKLTSTSARRESNPKNTGTEVDSEPIPDSSSSELGSSNSSETKKPQSSSSNSVISTPKQPGSSIKRITPTLLTSANVNPVFNTSVVIEKQTVDSGEKSANFSVVTINNERPAWDKLRRKSITPKIPGLVPPKVTENFTVLIKSSKATILDCPTKDDGTVTTSDLPSDRRKAGEVSSSPTKKLGASIQPTNSQKRKAQPVKRTPEKAKNIAYNFMLVSHDLNKPSSSTTSSENRSESVSSVKKTPELSLPEVEVITNVNPEIVTSVPLANENSLDVTPMQPPPQRELSSSSGFKTISPNALHRLIASESKGSTAAPVQFPRKKSYSTPRKRHVRNLSFATPPSLKAKTPLGGQETGASKKRKSDEEWSTGDFKSKKRLNWPDSEKIKSPLVELGVKNSDTSKVSDNQEIRGENQDHPLAVDVTKNPSSSKDDNVSKKASMSVILEESVLEPAEPQQPIVANAVNDVGQVEVTNAWSQPTSTESKVTYITLPASQIDSNTPYQYYQIGDDMQTFYPIQIIPPGSSTSGIHPAPEQEHLPPTTVKLIQTPNEPNLQTMSFHSQTSNPLPQEVPPPHTSNGQPIPSISPHIQSANHPEITSAPPLPTQPYRPSIFSPVQQKQPDKLPLPMSSLALSNLSSSTKETVIEQNLPDQDVTTSTIPSDSSSKDILHHATQQKSIDSIKPGRPQSQGRSSELPTPDNLAVATATPPSSSQSMPVEPAVNSSATASINVNELDSNAKEDSRQRRKRRSKASSSTTSSSSTAISKSPSLPAEQGSPRRIRKSTRISEIRKQPEVKVPVELKGKASSRKPRTQHIDRYTQEQKEANDVESTTKGETGKGKGSRKGAPPKKPKLTMNSKGIKMNVNDLFGDTPIKNKSNNKRSPEAVAAQMVAADAVPLGSPRRSPRKHPMMIKQLDKSPLIHKPASNFGCFPHSENNENSVKSLSVLPPQENTVFNIVPAPLGFPEPTPIKNFMETGCLNISNIGFDHSLITPLKSNPVPSLNETQFTLPPTPRLVVDQDSNSNSAHSLKLMYDGMYPFNLFSSTPLKSGIPRTPGKESSSSNSYSPILKTTETAQMQTPSGQWRPPQPPLTLVEPPQPPANQEKPPQPSLSQVLPPKPKTSQVQPPQLPTSQVQAPQPPTSQAKPSQPPANQGKPPQPSLSKVQPPQPPTSASQVKLPQPSTSQQVQPPQLPSCQMRLSRPAPKQVGPPQPSSSQSRHFASLVGTRQNAPMVFGLPQLAPSQVGSSFRPGSLVRPPQSQCSQVENPRPPPARFNNRFIPSSTTTANQQHRDSVITSVALDLSSPRHADKSDGELSSSDGEQERRKKAAGSRARTTSQKQVQKVVAHNPSACVPSKASSTKPHSSALATQLVHPVGQQQQHRRLHHPQIPTSVNPNTSRADSIKFQVAGNGKSLTFSAEEKLVSLALVQMGNGVEKNEVVKENVPTQHKPEATSVVQKPTCQAAGLYTMLQNRTVVDLIKLVHKKHMPQNL